MTIKIATFTKEGFVSGLALVAGNGLVLRTSQDMLWIGRDARHELVRQFEEFVDSLRESGFEVEDPGKQFAAYADNLRGTGLDVCNSEEDTDG